MKVNNFMLIKTNEVESMLVRIPNASHGIAKNRATLQN